MATRPIVPRANGEGSLGVSTKSWGGVFTNELNGANAVDMADFSKATLRQPSTAYTTGAMANHVTLPAGWYLECTTAGTTGSGTLTITTPTVGGTVSDGTVTWTIRKNASTQDLTGYLPLSGGKMTGENIILKSTDNSVLRIIAGTSSEHGAALHFYGDEHPKFPGVFFIKAASDNSVGLLGRPNGTLTWGDNSLDKSAVVAESLGATDQQYATTGYRKYASGLIEQWGIWYSDLQTGTITFPISFPNKCTSINVSMLVGAGTMQTICVGALSETSFGFKKSVAGNGFAWRAVGY